ncbi:MULTISPECIES: hypothetical protein [Clostridiaceae]|uniref:DUF5626 domain-containing protein n=1 Tax=Clostridium facile TaxID=2763035 RepID=A0ABR7IPL1_9CLOT|nr:MULTISPECIES: hypothetical protein [Clostridiaceae]MBC5787075.1 hypothetical protein [Clostridium facile]
MKQLKTKILSACLASVMLVSTTATTVYAAEPQQTSQTFVCNGNTEEVTPYLDYLNQVWCDISYNNNTFTGSGNYVSFSSNKIVQNVYIEKSTNNSNWSVMRSNSRTYNPGNGAKVLSTIYSTSVSGYYRAKTTVLVYSSSGSIVESVTVYSKTIHI